MKSNLGYLESIDSGSNYSFGDKMERASAPRSLFDLSHLCTTTLFNAGGVVPLTWFETLPGDDIDINVSSILRVLPQVVPMYSRERLYVYAFWSRYYDLTDIFDVFMRKGYSGDVIEQLPVMNGNGFNNDQTIVPESLGDYLGLPVGATSSELFGAGVSALPFMMYLRIWRDYFCNKNYFINDRVILPDDDSRFRLGKNGQLLSATDNGVTFSFDFASTSYDGLTFDDDSNSVYHFGLFSHLYPSDYFMSALPFTQRGTAPSLKGTIPSNSIGIESAIDFANAIVPEGGDGNVLPIGINRKGQLGIVSAPLSASGNSPFITVAETGQKYHIKGGSSGSTVMDIKFTGDTMIHPNTDVALVDALNKAVVSSSVVGSDLSLGITLNDIRKLAVEQIELEKMARTDGSYFQFGLTFFGEPSKSARDYRPYYIGGTYKNIVFTEVLQTAGSSVGTTDPSSSSPLGAYAGHGITGITDGRLGHVHCDDYGMVMILACIMPDIYYSQGLDKKWTKINQADFYLPERARLGMIPILNQELFYAGNNGTNEGEDRYLWAYQNPFDELRYIPNRICGKIADPNNKSFFPYTQSRKFDRLPNWSREFAQASDVRKDSFFAPSESAYSAQFSFDIRAVRPLPYKPVPAKII